jgi:hypothetical protein
MVREKALKKDKKVKKLPTGKVIAGCTDFLELSDGQIQRGQHYVLPATEDGKTAGKFGKVTDIEVTWTPGTDTISFWVRLVDDSGQGWQFEYKGDIE